MKVKLCPVGMYQSNTYIVYDENSLEALIIDPGDAPQTIIDYLHKNSLQPRGIILTHCHSDHVGAAEKVKGEFNCPVYIHKDDEEGLKELGRYGIWNLVRPRIELHPDQLLQEDDLLTAGEVTLKVIHTPGHTPGSICLEAVGANVVFTGDTVFADGIGRTDFKGGSLAEMRISLHDKVNGWADGVTICPGHGPTATMSQIRARNGLFRTMVAETN